MMKKILVFPCGSEIGLEIHRSFRYSKEFSLVGGSSTDDHGAYMYDDYIGNIPFVEDENFIDEINKTIEKKHIDFIFPAHDSVVLKLAENSDQLKAKMITSPLETCQITRSKRKTYEFFDGILPVPKLYNSDNVIFPAFVKPDVGQGSKGAQVVNNQKELDHVLDSNKKEILIMELLPGEEYTIDCLTAADGNLLYARGRIRERTKDGISVASSFVDKEDFYNIAKVINDKLEFKGVWFVQVKYDKNGQLKILEIAPRVAGTMALSRIHGVNLPMLSAYIFQDKPVDIINNKFHAKIDRALSNLYKTNLDIRRAYVDFDDSLLVGQKVNYFMLAAIYKLKQNGAKVSLITKHANNIHDTLKSLCITEDIFDEIISLEKSDKKSDHIDAEGAIFIDDSFSERKQVGEIKDIPVFDVNEFLEMYL